MKTLFEALKGKFQETLIALAVFGGCFGARLLYEGILWVAAR